eukprot:TRINITY_DN5603_c1_g1_i1.p1 TRINITY_DN5603_c1_g1~~TRINITY_DN5603_c1_g1_i1.p1  ORF type:complete len:320 (-),score=84.88 TRINITY_DN5603_c1_g1_i1:96-1055(-)
MEQLELSGRPSIHDLFSYYNVKHFDGKLGPVRVEWSKRLTRCAGLCYFRRRGGAEECYIRLSEALLQFRPFSDTLNTLLHEMIHAFLFVTHNWRDQSDHGPQFCSIMERINKREGTHITVYHSFHEEVAHFQTHWWKCQGRCGRIIRRAMNRAPSRHDSWWRSHERECGGAFLKIAEPPSMKKKKCRKEGGRSLTEDDKKETGTLKRKRKRIEKKKHDDEQEEKEEKEKRKDGAEMENESDYWNQKTGRKLCDPPSMVASSHESAIHELWRLGSIEADCIVRTQSASRIPIASRIVRLRNCEENEDMLDDEIVDVSDSD